MADHHSMQADYGTSEKKLGIYSAGMIACIILTLISFWAVMSGQFSQTATFVIIFTSACIQFFVQLVCFLRLNINTLQGKLNVTALVYTGVILFTVIIGTLWIMWNLGYNMMT